MSIYKFIATCAWCLLAAGVLMRRRRRLHTRLMLSGITLDALLVLYLEFTRDAIKVALSFSLNYLSQLHIAASSIAVLLYFPVVYLGFKLYLGGSEPSFRAWHLRLASAAFLFRTTGFVLMFFVTPANQ